MSVVCREIRLVEVFLKIIGDKRLTSEAVVDAIGPRDVKNIFIRTQTANPMHQITHLADL